MNHMERITDFRSGRPRLSRAMGNFDRSPSRAKLYAYILEQPTLPSMEAMRAHMGWRNTASVNNALLMLFSAGYLHKIRDGVSFTWVVPDEARADFEAWRKEGKP